MTLKFAFFLFPEPLHHELSPWIRLLNCDGSCHTWTIFLAGFIWSLLGLGTTLPTPSINWRLSWMDSYPWGIFLSFQYRARAFPLMIKLPENSCLCFSTGLPSETIYFCFSLWNWLFISFYPICFFYTVDLNDINNSHPTKLILCLRNQQTLTSSKSFPMHNPASRSQKRRWMDSPKEQWLTVSFTTQRRVIKGGRVNWRLKSVERYWKGNLCLQTIILQVARKKC